MSLAIIVGWSVRLLDDKGQEAEQNADVEVDVVHHCIYTGAGLGSGHPDISNRQYVPVEGVTEENAYRNNESIRKGRGTGSPE